MRDDTGNELLASLCGIRHVFIFVIAAIAVVAFMIRCQVFVAQHAAPGIGLDLDIVIVAAIAEEVITTFVHEVDLVIGV